MTNGGEQVHQTELESRTNSLEEGDELSGYATIDAGLNAITTKLRWIVWVGLGFIALIAVLAWTSVDNLRDARQAGDDAACNAIERLAVANERFIRDVAGPGEVTDERLSIYHLYIDPAIEACRQEAASQQADRPIALRP